ncbi:MAG TPA: Uma2 family endonuclease [Gemmataceae bacterium]|jgi:Uma2 family endonuclease|nr:Uma2 family endonuclease [Gemmataceae bacterium]
MSTIATPRATLADLAKTEGKAELIGGRIVQYMATGHRPSRVAARIFRSLDDFAESTGNGFAYTDSIGYAVAELTSGRESFSPDASFFAGPPPENEMSFVEGAPAFAVEVRSENDYGPAAEREIAAKRSDYFEAGTIVVWDVDPKANIIRSYSSGSAEQPELFAAGQMANAERAVPGWRIDVELMFRP